MDITAENWTSYAACTQKDPETGEPVHDPELFFPPGEKGTLSERQARKAKRICTTRCPDAVRAHCLEHALALKINSGVFGGHTPEERRALLRRKRKTTAPVGAQA